MKRQTFNPKGYTMKYEQALFKKIKVSCLLASICTMACAAPEMSVTRFAASPKIDGELNDPCWRQASACHIKAAELTRVMVGYDDNHLYIAFDCRNSGTNAIAGKICHRDGDIFSKEDSVEIFLNPRPGKTEYYQLAVNCKGSKFDGVRRGKGTAFSSSWNEDWDAAAKIGPTGYVVEIGIPFRILRMGTNTTWRANFCRNTAYNDEHNAWSQTKEFHQPEKFGLLKGINAPIYQSILLEKLEFAGKPVIGRNYLDLELQNAGTEARKLQAKLVIPDKYDRKFQAQKPDMDIGATVFEVAPGTAKTTNVPFAVKSKGKMEYCFLIYDGNRLIYIETFNRNVDSEFAFKLQGKLLYEKETAVIRYESRLSPDLLDRVELKIVVSQNGKQVQEKKYGGRELQENAICPGDTASLPAGRYDISATLISDGKPMVEWNDTFMIIRKY